MANFIDETYTIDFSIPEDVGESIAIAENADKNNDLETYLVYAENLDVLGKNCYVSGEITKNQWDTIVKRFRT